MLIRVVPYSGISFYSFEVFEGLLRNAQPPWHHVTATATGGDGAGAGGGGASVRSRFLAGAAVRCCKQLRTSAQL
jgi:hypothetical protein